MEKKATSKRYPPELKERAVRMVKDLRQQDPGDKAVISRVARQLGVGDESLRAWVKQCRDRRRHAGRADDGRAGRAEGAAQGGEGAAPLQRHPPGGRDFLRGGARPPTEEVVAFIDAHRDNETGGRRWGVEPICEQLAVAPSTYYDAKSRPPSARAVRDAELGPDPGGPLEAQLLGLRPAQADQGGPSGRPRRRAGPGGPSHARPGHTGRQPGQEALHHQVRPDRRPGTRPRQPQLHRRRDPTRLWVADFTYCSTWSGIVYVAFVIDVFSRRLVGWKAARSMTTPLVLDALEHGGVDPPAHHPRRAGVSLRRRAVNTPQFPTPSDSTTSARRRPSAPSATATTTPWPNRSSGSSRPSCTATRPPWPPTAGPGRASTTSRSPPAPGCRGSTRSGCTQNSATCTPAEFEADYRQRSQPDVA